MEQVAWIGTGVMGAQQAGHLVRAGYPVKAYGHHFEKVEAQAPQFGFTACRTIAQAVADADFIFVMVGYPKDVEEVFCAPGGILESAKPGAIAVDMTTSSPTLAQRLYALGAEKGIAVLDAPVSGGDKGAREAGLPKSPAPLGTDGQKHSSHGPGGLRPAHQSRQPDRSGRRHRRLH